MTLSDRILLLSSLGNRILSQINKDGLKSVLIAAKNKNGWFTEDNSLLSLKNIANEFLNQNALERFTNAYAIEDDIISKKVGIVAAGNIPMVSFHDILCVFLSGNIAFIKRSSTDDVFITYLINQLGELNEEAKAYFQFAERLNAAEAIIATGSDNSARYFNYYFGNKPNIIRKNRTSVAVLTGNESKIELADLGNDIFRYFGLGCRNVSKLLVPKGYDFVPFFEAIEYWNTILIHHKYNNNYDYNKSIYLINLNEHLDNGFLLLKSDENLVSPLGVLFYQEFESAEFLKEYITTNEEKIQCVVGSSGLSFTTIPFGTSQEPSLADFADGVDTMAFLVGL